MNTTDKLAAALRKTRESLANWMEIQDDKDMRDYDMDALRAADEAIAEYEASKEAPRPVNIAHQLQVGDRVRVIAPHMTFGDYDRGDTAVVKRVEVYGATVTWEKRRFNDDKAESGRCRYLANEEFERIGSPINQADED